MPLQHAPKQPARDPQGAAEEQGSSLGRSLRQATALATLTAGFLLGAEGAHAQQTGGNSSVPEGNSSLVKPDREKAADEQWKAWRRAFKGQIPTETLGLDDLQRLIRDTSFRVSEGATLEMPLTMLVTESTGGAQALHGERLAAVARNSSTPLKEIEATIWKSYYAGKSLERNERDLQSIESDLRSLQGYKERASRLSDTIKTLDETIAEKRAERDKFRFSLNAVAEAESLLSKQAAGLVRTDEDRSRLKRACRNVGITSLDEARESQRILSSRVNAIESSIQQLEASKEKTSEELARTLPLADTEACEHFVRIDNLTRYRDHLEKTIRSQVAETEGVRNLSVATFIDPEKREKFRRDLAAIEAMPERTELVSHNELGNPSAKLVLDRGSSFQPRVLVAANEAGATITAQGNEGDVEFFIGKHEPLHVREIDSAASLENFLEGRDSLVFAEKGTVTSLKRKTLKYLSEISLQLCQGARFDMTQIGSYSNDIQALGGGVIVLGEKANQEARRPRIRIGTDSSSELVTVSIPAGTILSKDSISVERYQVSIELQALLTVNLKTPSSEGPGADVNIEVRGKSGSEQIPFVRNGKLVDSDIGSFIDKVHRVQ